MMNEILLKVVVIGNSGVGKTSILNSFIKNEYNATMQSTTGASFLSKSIQYRKKLISFQIWDTAGQERFHSLASVFYKGSHAAIVVYDITKKESFDGLKKWVEELEKNGPDNLVTVVVGNKIDLLEQESVSFDEGVTFCQEIGAVFKLTSAKNKIGINELFEKIAETYLQKYSESKIMDNYEKKLQIESFSAKKKEKCCLK